MQKIIKWCKQIVAIQKTSQRNLTLEEQISLIKLCKYRKIAKAIKKQCFDDSAVIELLCSSLYAKDKYYKLGISYYNRYGFSNKVKLYLLENMKSRGLVNFTCLFIDDYQITYKKPSFLNKNSYLELFSYGDEDVIGFFRKIKLLLAYLDNIEKVDIQNQQLDELFLEMDVQGTYILDDASMQRSGYVYQNQLVCRSEVEIYYPDFGVMLKILASGKDGWIDTLVSVLVQTNKVWKNVFGLEYKAIPDVLKKYLKINHNENN